MPAIRNPQQSCDTSVKDSGYKLHKQITLISRTGCGTFAFEIALFNIRNYSHDFVEREIPYGRLILLLLRRIDPGFSDCICRYDILLP